MMLLAFAVGDLVEYTGQFTFSNFFKGYTEEVISLPKVIAAVVVSVRITKEDRLELLLLHPEAGLIRNNYYPVSQAVKLFRKLA